MVGQAGERGIHLDPLSHFPYSDSVIEILSKTSCAWNSRLSGFKQVMVYSLLNPITCDISNYKYNIIVVQNSAVPSYRDTARNRYDKSLKQIATC